MTVSTPRSALIHELALTVEGDVTLSALGVYRGFPDNLDFALPAVSVTANVIEISKSRRKVFRETDLGDGTCEVLFETERRELAATLELWTGSKTERESYELAIDALFETELDDYGYNEPRPPGLSLELSTLYDAGVRARLMDKDVQDAGGARDGYYRLIYMIQASIPKLVRGLYKQATFDTTTVVQVEPFGNGFSGGFDNGFG